MRKESIPTSREMELIPRNGRMEMENDVIRFGFWETNTDSLFSRTLVYQESQCSLVDGV